MFGFIIKRLLAAIPLLLILSMISFFLIQVPPGDYADRVKSQAITMSGMSEQDAQQMADKYREDHGMNASLPVQYVRWIGNIVTKGDFGDSYTYNKPISQLIIDRLPMTLLIALMCHFGSTVVGTLLGIFVATRQYSIADTLVTIFAFIGMTTPRFVLALIMLYLLVFHFGSTNVAALFSFSCSFIFTTINIYYKSNWFLFASFNSCFPTQLIYINRITINFSIIIFFLLSHIFL
jgi:peptide/nickel transport system permease protein